MTRWGARSALLAGPFILGVVVLLGVPMLLTGWYAFTNQTAFTPGTFTGLDNLRQAWRDPLVGAAMRASLVHALLTVPLRLAAATAFALALASPRRGNRIARAAVYLPSVLPDLSLALLALWAFNPVFGPVNGVLRAIGVTGPNWFGSPWGARVAIAAMMLLPIGEAFLVVLAARRSLDPSLYDAGRIDGASPRQLLRHITLPQIAPLLALLAVRDTILSLQVNVVPAYALTDGGPDSATLFFPVLIFDHAFELFRFGYGAFLTLALLVVTALLVLGQALFARSRGWL